MSHKTVVFTGGGSAGHVTPNMALIDHVQRLGWHCEYIGSKLGIERKLIKTINIPYHAIACGKLRRYFSLKTFVEPFKIMTGVVQAYRLLGRIKPDVIFSKGGFVAFPVVVAAWLHGIRVVIHEADFSPGLANRLSFPFASDICVSFPQTEQAIGEKHKVHVTGLPLRANLMCGSAVRGRKLCGFSDAKPILLVTGGGLGAQRINQALRDALNQLLDTFQVIHICGEGKVVPELDCEGYKQFAFVHEEYADLLACANCVVSRAGANAIYELLALTKPHVLIPLSKKNSRGDQLENANHFSELGLSVVLFDEELSAKSLTHAILELWQGHSHFELALNHYPVPQATEAIAELLGGAS